MSLITGFDRTAPAGFLPSTLDFEAELCEIDDCAYLATLCFIEGQPTIRFTRQLKGSWKTDYYLSQLMLARAENRVFAMETPTEETDFIGENDLRRIIERALVTLADYGQFDIRFYQHDPEIPF